MDKSGRLAEVHLAFVFLTRLPLPRLSEAAAATPLGRAAWAFPLVGAAVGLISAVALHLAHLLDLPDAAAVLAALAAGLWVTGALHEDGLADVADGFGGGADTARKLAIMRDSRIGSYGVLALILAVGLRWSAVLAVLQTAGVEGASAALIVAGALSRAAIPLGMAMLEPARADGLGAAAGRAEAPAVAVGIGLAVAVAWALLPGSALAPLFAVVLMAVLAVAGLARRHIGGYTGDVLGTVEQAAAVSALLALAAIAGD